MDDTLDSLSGGKYWILHRATGKFAWTHLLIEVVLTARDGCMVYLDDVLVIGRDFEEHNRNLAEVLERLQLAGLRLKPEKCKFAQPT